MCFNQCISDHLIICCILNTLVGKSATNIFTKLLSFCILYSTLPHCYNSIRITPAIIKSGKWFGSEMSLIFYFILNELICRLTNFLCELRQEIEKVIITSFLNISILFDSGGTDIGNDTLLSSRTTRCNIISSNRSEAMDIRSVFVLCSSCISITHSNIFASCIL